MTTEEIRELLLKAAAVANGEIVEEVKAPNVQATPVFKPETIVTPNVEVSPVIKSESTDNNNSVNIFTKTSGNGKIQRTKGNITLSDEQYEGVEKAVDWFYNSNKQTFELAGYAGTGKSTVVDFFLSSLNVKKEEIHLCAPTGTASLVLQSKTPQYTCSTLHRAIYTAVELPNGQIKFELAYEGLQGIKLLVVDEASMIGTKIGKDLLDVARVLGVKVLIIGDPGQLPPVNDSRAFLENPDYTLTKVMRQAEDNYIIKASMAIRNNQWKQADGIKKYGNNGEVMTVSRSKVDQEKLYNKLAGCINNGGGVVVGKNKTRVSLTEKVRRILGFESKELMNGERIMIKQNVDLTKGEYVFSGEIDMLTNGMVGIVSNVEDKGYYYNFDFSAVKFNLVVKNLQLRKDILSEKVSYTGRKTNSLPVILKAFELKTGKKQVAGINAIFGYVVTCHNSQGSQWDTVYVFDESNTFQQDSTRWLYTAVTRAAKQLVLIKEFGSGNSAPQYNNHVAQDPAQQYYSYGPNAYATDYSQQHYNPMPTQQYYNNNTYIAPPATNNTVTSKDCYDQEKTPIVYPVGHCIPEELVNVMNDKHYKCVYKEQEISIFSGHNIFERNGFMPVICKEDEVVYEKGNTQISVGLVVDQEKYEFGDRDYLGLFYEVKIK